METDYFRDVWPRVVARRYDGGGWMIALVEMDIEVMGELLRIPAGHKLTRDQALAYPGDVQHVWRRDETSGTGLSLTQTLSQQERKRRHDGVVKNG